MKKITLTLLTALSSASMVYSQTNISIEAPVHTLQNFVDVLPGGSSSDATLTALYLVNQSELSALTGTALTGLGIQLAQGTGGPAVNGTFTIYLQNTADVTYSAGVSFTAATGTMSTVYTGNYNVPASTNASTVNFTFPQTFTYTGNGLYVGFKWQSAGPFVTANATLSNLAAYVSNNSATAAMGAFEEVAAGSTITDVLNPVTGRPSLLFKAVNTSTNEIGVLEVIAPGFVAKSLAAPQQVMAYVRNSSTITKSNVTVSLTVTGSNPYSTVYTIPSIAAGSTFTVPFAAFNPTIAGTNHMTVSTSPDQNLQNNVSTWTQSVTCNVMGNNPPDPITSYTSGIGFQNGGIFSTSITIGPNASTLTAVRISISSDAGNSGKSLCGVIMDDQANVIAYSDTLLAANASFQTFRFEPAQALSPNTTYYVGLAQLTGPQFPMGCEIANIAAPLYFASPLAGGGLTPNSNFGYFGIEPILGPELAVTISNTLICKGESVDLAVTGGSSTYTWSAVPNTTANAVSSPNAANVTVAPASTASYTVKGTDLAGCTNSVTLKVTVSPCAGIYANVIKDANIILFPNPAVSGKCSVTGLEGANTISVYNMLGQQVVNKSTSEGTFAIDLTSQPEGNYLVKIVDSSNHAKTIKFINQH